MTEYTADGTAYELSGRKGAPVIVLIHGLGLSREIWSDYVNLFAEEYQVLAYDLYGHGESAPPPETASLKVFSDQIIELLDTLSIDNAHVIGFSIGGMINRRLAMDHPNRVAGLVILNSPHDRGDAAQEQVEARAIKVREQGPMATMDDALKRWFTTDYLAGGVYVQQVREWRQQVDAESYAQSAWVLANGVRELIRPKTKIDVPTLIITCENDSGSTPKMSHKISEEINGSEVKIIPGLRHLGLLEDPSLFAEPILEFLREIE